MNTNEQLYFRRHTEYAHLTVDARAAEAIASDNNWSFDSVRGRLSLGNTPLANKELMKYAAMEVPDVGSSEERQQEIIRLSDAHFNATKRAYEDIGTERTVITMADGHIPFMRWDSAELTCLIIEDVKPDYVTAGHDTIDNDGYGRWEDERPVGAKRWSSDIANIRRAEKFYYSMIKSAAPKHMQLLEVFGNHCAWFYRHLRSNSPQSAEHTIAEYMDWKYELGILQFTRGRENAIHLSPNLVLWHGQFAQQSPLVNAKNTIKQFMKDGTAKSVIVGHTHRPVKIAGSAIDYDGVNFYNAPCLSRLTDIPYLKADPIGWKLGININHFVPNTRYERGENIIYDERGDYLVAHYADKEYKVRLDKQVAK